MQADTETLMQICTDTLVRNLRLWRVQELVSSICFDSTSAVDTATEAEIRKSFSTSLKDATKLIIAQRISSVEHPDRILVMDEGEIVGQGTHEELMKSCEAYQEIYYSQKDKNEEVSA